MITKTSYFQDVIETVEKLPPDNQMLLVEIIRLRLLEKRRMDLVAEVAEARREYQAGEVSRGTMEELMGELAA